MSLRPLLPAILLGFTAFCQPAWAAAPTSETDPRLVPSVQTYAEQAVPVPPPQSQGYYPSPLAAGTLTLQDVLEAHKPNPAATLPVIGANATPTSTATAPILTPPNQASSTSLMMSQGMKSVLQKVNPSSAPPISVGPAQGQPTPLTDASGIKYEPGQGPKNLATGSDASSIAATPANPTGAACDQNVQKWEKTCGDAGYPTSYVGKIVGETHTGCADGALHDVWVSNSCAPPEAGNAQSPKVNAVCGVASNNEFDVAPTTNLCAQGTASTVSGEGPWTWACSGSNGGAPAACAARIRVASQNGVCGGANGVATGAAPETDLCNAGSPTKIKGTGPWTWQCRGSGKGTSESCIAPVLSANVAVSAEPPAAESATAAAVTEAAPVPSAAMSPASISETSSGDIVPAVSEKGELCGEAAQTLAYEAPDKDLCRSGTASVVNGDGPWSWSCTDNEGRSSSCRTLSLNKPSDAPKAAEATTVPPIPELPAPQMPKAGPRVDAVPPSVAATSLASRELACGLAASQGTLQRPSEELCVNGKASSVRGSGPWHWTCAKGKQKISCETPKVVDGTCGAANGAALRSAPFAGLCSAGTPTGIEGEGPWTWTCNGTGGGVNVSCAASVQGKVSGACGASANTTLMNAPTDGLCSSGTPSAVSGSGPWTWSCSGSQGGTVASCSATKVAATAAPGPKVNGLCGVANGVMTSSTPVEGLCADGTVTPVIGSGPWNWSCLGENGGMTVSCTAPMEPPAPIDGICGPANGVETLVKPQGGLCSSGITGTVSGKGPWTWTCSGANGGSPVSCIAPVAGRSSATGSLTTSASPSPEMMGDIPPPPAAETHSALVTPRLGGSNATPPVFNKKSAQRAAANVKPSEELKSPRLDEDAAAALNGDLAAPPPETTIAAADTASVLPETEGERAAHIPGNHLTLDPTISTILFSRNSGNIDETVLSTLDKLSAVLLSNPDVRITLTAYADNVGSTPRDARRLSLTRALAVRDYLAAHGISDTRVDVRAEGANTTSGYIDRVDVKVND